MRWADRARRRGGICKGQLLLGQILLSRQQQGWPNKGDKNFSSLRAILNQLLVILEGAGHVKSLSFALHQGFP
jgi:transposase